MFTALRGCTALITGASAGIGTEFARQLAPHAASLILVARREDRLRALEQELRAAHPKLQVYWKAVDLADPAQVKGLISWLHEGDFPVSILINNAGLGDYGPFTSASWEKLDTVLKVNVSALTQLSHALLPTLRKQAFAHLMNVSSVASLIPMPNFAVYAASKAYVTSLSEALRHELRHTTVGVTALCPGPVATEFGSVAYRSAEDRVSPESMYVSVQKVVEDALIGIVQNKPRVLPGLKIALVMGLVSLLPIFLVRLFFHFMPATHED
jgi:short-subunit dehydrogenase